MSSSFPVFSALADPGFAEDPSAAYQEAHATPGPGVFEMPNGDGLVITRYQTLNKLKVHPDLQAQNRSARVSGSGQAGMLAELSSRGPFFMNEPEHAPTAQAVYRPMSPSRNHPLIDQITAIAQAAMDEVIERREADLVKDYAYRIAARFWIGFLGLPDSALASLSRWSAAIVPMLAFDRTEQQVDAANAAAAQMWEFLRAHYVQLRESGPQDTAFHLMAPYLQDSDVAGVPDNPADPIAAMTFDGLDSVTTATANVLYTCLTHPAQYALLKEDPELVKPAWAEAMRYQPSLLGLHRACRRPVDYDDVQLPEGVNILMMWAAANRDPRAFDDPDQFDIQRGKSRFLTFGGGARMCKGRHLAMLQGEIALRVLLERTREVELTSDDPRWGPPGNIRAIQAIPVRVAPR